jgi:hypothetical protein
LSGDHASGHGVENQRHEIKRAAQWTALSGYQSIFQRKSIATTAR